MEGETIDLGQFALMGEPPLPSNIAEEYVTLVAKDGAIIKGLLNYPLDVPITQKALFLHEITGQKDGGTMEVIARRYAKMGIASFRIDFSGHGERKDEWERYTPTKMLHDAIQSIDFLDKRFPEIEKTIATGFSTGGSIAVMLRYEDERISKACLLYPVLSYKHNFLAAVYNDDELICPKDISDLFAPWRAYEFTEEKINASLEKDEPFELSGHKFGPEFIKDCKRIIDEMGDIDGMLIDSPPVPLTVIQGTKDFAIPSNVTHMFHMMTKEIGTPFRLAFMSQMNHFVPPEWKNSVWHQFKRAATISEDKFKPDFKPIRLKNPPSPFADVLLQQPTNLGHGLSNG